MNDIVMGKRNLEGDLLQRKPNKLFYFFKDFDVEAVNVFLIFMNLIILMGIKLTIDQITAKLCAQIVMLKKPEKLEEISLEFS